VSWKKVYGLNRAILEESSNRYFYVHDPTMIDVLNLPDSELRIIKRSLHPDYSDRGNRKLPLESKLYITSEDYKKTGDNRILRLMDAINVCFNEGKTFYKGKELEDARKSKAMIVQWVPVNGAIHAEVVMPDNTVTTGFIEPSASNLKVDDVVQLERFGFARLDEVIDKKMRFYFAHK
jgi:glutamyl-tRNA synthetase